MTERKCCNCCRFAEPYNAPVRRARKGSIPNYPEGKIVCRCKFGQAEGPFYGDNFYFTRRPCAFFMRGIHSIYGVDDENYYIDWIKAKMTRMILRVDDIDDEFIIKPNMFHEYDELNSHLQYHRQLKKYPRNPQDYRSKYAKLL